VKQESVSDSRGVFLVKLLGQMKRKEKEEEKRKVSTYSKASLYLFDPCGQAVTHLLPPILFSALQEIPFYVLRITSVLFVKLRYKPEGRGFDFRWCHWNISLT
jgi:hypothetical protein